MNISLVTHARRLLRFGLLAFALSFSLPTVRAGLTFDLRLIREQQGQSYNFYVELYTNSTPPAAALGNYLINSPQQPTNGSWRQFDLTTNGLNFTGGGNNSFGDFGAVMQQITNGNWTIVFTNATTTNHFQFTVSASNLTSNMLPALIVTLPNEGGTLPTTQPTITWQWPDGWGVNSDAFMLTNNLFFQYASLPEAQHTWFMATPLPVGENLHLQLRYTTNHLAPLFVATTPLESNTTQPIAGWISASGLTSIENVNFAVTNSVSSGGAHTLVAHYDFDDSGNLGHDSSGQGNEMAREVYWGPQHQFATNAEAGGGAIRFFGTDAIFAENQALTNLNAVLAGSFTFSAWVNTTVTNGEDYNNAFYGAVIFWAYNDHGNTNDTIPLAITGSKAAFTTRGEDSGASDTLHSTNSLNDGNYHLITVTRDQATGEKKIYIDGQFEASEIGTTNALNGNNYNLTIGGWNYFIDGTGTNYSSYNGLLDDVQIYTGVLSDADIASMYANPGTTLDGGVDFNAALNTTNLTWSVGGNTNWFIETTIAHDSILAAQSGAIGDGQTNWIETIAPAGGLASFYWKVSSETNWDYLTFYINGVKQDAISGAVDWVQQSNTVSLGDVLRWEYTKDDQCCFEGLDAAWLDQVVLPAAVVSQYPVDVDLQFHIACVRDNGNEYYCGSVSFNSVSPEAATTNAVRSPHGFYNAEQYPGSGSSGSQLSSSLGEVINEFTNGFWNIYINQGSPTQQVYSFQASISGLSTNLLKPIVVFSPTNGAVNVATNPVFYWSGLTNFSTLVVDLLSGPTIFPPVSTTNWPAAPTLNYGPDRFDVGYTSNNFPGVTFTAPVEVTSSAPLQSWTTTVNLDSSAFTYFTVGAPAPLPVQLLDFHGTGGNLQFSFQTLAGRPHTIQARTNLSTDTWIDLSNFVGNGALKTISITNSVFGGAKQGFIRVSTQ